MLDISEVQDVVSGWAKQDAAEQGEAYETPEYVRPIFEVSDKYVTDVPTTANVNKQ